MAARNPILPFFEGRLGKLREMRFWSLVEIGTPDVCWPWKGSASKGYGRFKIASYETRIAPRVAFTIAKRMDPGELLVRHTCDNPPCCNPSHLELGTHADNANDKMVRGRWRGGDQAGVNNPRALLSEPHLEEIVRGLRAGETNMSIARRVPVGHSLISRIRVGLSWRRETAALGYEPRAQFQRKGAQR